MSHSLIKRFTAAAVGLVTAVAMTIATAGTAAADPAGANVVVNEVYGGGGNSGATLTNDFIELYNPTGTAADLSGWSVQYASSSGTSWQITPLIGSIPAGGHYLVEEKAGANGTEALPTPDASGSIPMSGSKGKVALVSSDTELACDDQCSTDASVVDFVGFGSADDYEGAGPAPTISNATSDARTNGVDTDDNSADFTKGAPTPQNSDDGGTPSPVTITDPGTQRATVDTAFGPVTLSASGGSDPYSWTATGLPSGVSITTDGVISGTPTAKGTSSVTVTATDANADIGTADFSFEVSAQATELAIAEIQGTDTDTSPYNGDPVITGGIVTAVYATGGLNGFYLQTGGSGSDADHPDQTPGASDGVFVYGSYSAGQVSIGESVKVSGTVEEFRPPTETTGPTTTEITYPTVTTLSTALPAVIPTAIPWTDLESDAQKEAHEGELMAPPGDFTVSDNYAANTYGAFTLASGKTPLQQPTDAAEAGSQAAQDVVADNARRTITLDDGSSWNYLYTEKDEPLPWLTHDNPVRIGSAVSFNAPVILEYRNDMWNFQPQQQVTDDGADVVTFSSDRAANEHPANVGGDIRLATFNVENYFPMTGERYVSEGLGTCTWYLDRDDNKIGVNRCTGTDGSQGPRGAATHESFERQQGKIVTGLNHLDASIVSLEEIENSVKFGEPRDTALAGLVDALNAAAGSDVWAYAPSPDVLPSAAEQDVIRNALIYKPADITPVGVSQVLSDKSGVGQSFSIAREPLAQAFKEKGVSNENAFVVVANHFKSKGGGDPLYPGDEENADPASNQGAFNATRVHEAGDLTTYASQVASNAGTDKIFLLGDFNAYTHEDPMEALYQDGYTDLGGEFDPAEATYSYNGLEGSLDHVLANPAALEMVTGADVWQINAQESVAFAYSRYNYNVSQLFDGNEPFAASDHDPVVVGLALPSAPAAPDWNSHKVYRSGDEVSYHGSTWRAMWWTCCQKPGSPWGAWEEIVTAPDGTAIWTPSRVFTHGDVAIYHGTEYVAKWWTRNQHPGQWWGPWRAKN